MKNHKNNFKTNKKLRKAQSLKSGILKKNFKNKSKTKEILKNKKLVQSSSNDISDNLDSKIFVESIKSKEKVTESSELNFSADDPFIFHFNKILSKEQGNEISDNTTWTSHFENWPILQRLKVQFPQLNKQTPRPLKLLLDDEDNFDPPVVGRIPSEPFTSSSFISKCHIYPKETLQNRSKSFTALQREIMTFVSQYIDFYYPYATFEKWESLRSLYLMHCINHILKTNKTIVSHNQEIIKLKEEKKDFDLPKFSDQGLSRPKVLILLPFKNSAYRVIKMIISQLGLEVKNKKRFEDDFGSPNSAEDEQTMFKNKPEDFSKYFEGDIKEDFKIGLTITPHCLKLYSEFFQSDIIVTSPLGLRYCLDTAKKDDEVAFLSSIEILVLDQADAFLMQNWEHILIIMESLNKYPRNLRNLTFDLYRARRWCLDGLSHQYRQTMIFSALNSDLVRALFAKTNNFAGKVQVLNFKSSGSLADVSVNAQLILHKVPTPTNSQCYSPDDQFTYFSKELLPRLRSKDQSHTLIYIPDYCDYIRLVRFFKDDGGSSISTINEYMIEENSKVAKARSLFFEGKRKFLLYTERFHFYRRYKIKGIQHVVFYGLPTYPHFFPEICNFMKDEMQNPREPLVQGLKTITVPFQSWDTAKLVDLLGSAKAASILGSDKSIHVTVVGT